MWWRRRCRRRFSPPLRAYHSMTATEMEALFFARAGRIRWTSAAVSARLPTRFRTTRLSPNWIERQPPELKVVGSNPARRTIHETPVDTHESQCLRGFPLSSRVSSRGHDSPYFPFPIYPISTPSGFPAPTLPRDRRGSPRPSRPPPTRPNAARPAAGKSAPRRRIEPSRGDGRDLRTATAATFAPPRSRLRRRPPARRAALLRRRHALRAFLASGASSVRPRPARPFLAPLRASPSKSPRPARRPIRAVRRPANAPCVQPLPRGPCVRASVSSSRASRRLRRAKANRPPLRDGRDGRRTAASVGGVYPSPARSRAAAIAAAVSPAGSTTPTRTQRNASASSGAAANRARTVSIHSRRAGGSSS